MESWQLPPKLDQLERLLASEPRPVPSVLLRRRVLGDIGVALRRDRAVARWRFAVGLAAVLCIGVSISFASLPNPASAMPTTQTLYDVADRLQALSPGLSREDSLRQASVRQMGVAAGNSVFGEIDSSSGERP